MRRPARALMGRRSVAGALAGSVLALAAGCAVNPVTGQSELMLVTEEQELALGREAFPELLWQDGGPLEVDEATRAYLAEIVQRLVRVSHRPGLPVDFTLHGASVPNAWAIPGHTAMTRGLLQELENEAQFAFVMGHEVGHVAARHSAKRQSYGLLGGAFLGLGGLALGAAGEAGESWSELALGAAAVGTKLVLLRYDRQQELEADRLGVLYMARAGYDPGEAVRAHRVLDRAADRYLANLGRRREEPGALAELLSTHPRQSVRVEEIDALVRSLPPAEVRRAGDGLFAERWQRATAGVRGVAPAYARYDRAREALAQGDTRAARRELDQAMRLADQAQFSTLEGAILLHEQRPAEARQAFARALGRYPGYQPALHGLGVAEYAQRRPAAAVPALTQSVELRPDYAPSRYLLGLTLLQNGEPRGAIPHLRAVAQANPRHPAAYGALALAYEGAGEARAAAAAWRAQFRAAPDSPLGRTARERLGAMPAAAAEPYFHAGAHVRLALPPAWEVAAERSWRKGGEVVLRRQAPEVVLRIASDDHGTPQDLGARLDEWMRARIGETRVTLVRESRSARIGGREGIARRVEGRQGGALVEHLFAVLARSDRVWRLETAAGREAWQNRDVRAEIERLLDSLELTR